MGTKDATELDDAALESLRADVMAVPPDRQALGLAEAIQKNAQYSEDTLWEALAIKVAVIADLAERLIPLLERQAAERDRLREQNAGLLAALDRLTIVGSAATGYLMADFGDMHEYVEEIMGRPVFTHEMGSESIAGEIREKAHPDFVEALVTARAAIAEAQEVPVRDRAKEALYRIASERREGEPFDDQMTGSDHQERCERSPAAAYQALDSLILIARAAIAEAQEVQQ